MHRGTWIIWQSPSQDLPAGMYLNVILLWSCCWIFNSYMVGCSHCMQMTLLCTFLLKIKRLTLSKITIKAFYLSLSFQRKHKFLFELCSKTLYLVTKNDTGNFEDRNMCFFMNWGTFLTTHKNVFKSFGYCQIMHYFVQFFFKVFTFLRYNFELQGFFIWEWQRTNSKNYAKIVEAATCVVWKNKVTPGFILYILVNFSDLFTWNLLKNMELYCNWRN